MSKLYDPIKTEKLSKHTQIEPPQPQTERPLLKDSVTPKTVDSGSGDMPTIKPWSDPNKGEKIE